MTKGWLQFSTILAFFEANEGVLYGFPQWQKRGGQGGGRLIQEFSFGIGGELCTLHQQTVDHEETAELKERTLVGHPQEGQFGSIAHL